MLHTLFHYVRLYLELGWHLIPLNGKVPPKGFPLKDALCGKIQSLEEVAALFPPSYHGNVGIVTGKGSNLAVVDVDDLVDAAWAYRHFSKTPFVGRTGKQGFHLYFRYPSGGVEIGCRTRLFGRRVDLRSVGGYVVAPPSVHPETGRNYRWVTPLEQLHLCDMPVFDRAWLPETRTPATPPASVSCQNTNARIERARNYLNKVTCVSGRSSHNTLYRACSKLSELFRLNESEMLHLLLKWNQSHCFNENNNPYPWSRRELEHKISDVTKILKP